MMWIAVAAYFAFACAVVALLFLPSVREQVWAGATQWWRRVGNAQRQAREAAQRSASGPAAQASETLSGVSRWLRRNWLAVGAAVLILVVPPALVFSLRGLHTLEGYDDTLGSTSGENAVIAALLQGEQLVPPPPLPPEVFATAEVISVRPQLGSANRNWELLDADFRQRLLVVYRIMKDEHNYEMVLLEGYRSPERQNTLAGMGNNVTNAAAWQSYHQYGLAADSAFMRNGKLVISERDPWAMRGYELYGEVAQRVGLTWGGRWKNMDLGHVEWRKPGFRPKVGG
jgi:peptidoglycan L-alanyl-D-glutamate endopeptidase CwlK